MTRLTTVGRGYDAAHRAERARWQPHVQAGLVACWRCGRPILPGTPWDLGHDDYDRTSISRQEKQALLELAGVESRSSSAIVRALVGRYIQARSTAPEVEEVDRDG
jgi:hypothetical protein